MKWAICANVIANKKGDFSRRGGQGKSTESTLSLKGDPKARQIELSSFWRESLDHPDISSIVSRLATVTSLASNEVRAKLESLKSLVLQTLQCRGFGSSEGRSVSAALGESDHNTKPCNRVAPDVLASHDVFGKGKCVSEPIRRSRFLNRTITFRSES
jgi:hypothetical protein